MEPGPDSSLSKALFDPLDSICEGSNLEIVGFLLFLDGPNDSSQLLVLTFECSKVAIRRPISVDISKNSSVSEAIQGVVNSPIKRMVQV